MTIFQRRKDRSSDRHKVIATVLVYEASERCQGGMTRSCARGEGFDVIVSRPNSRLLRPLVREAHLPSLRHFLH
jgi:hypothetical protein